MLWKVAKISKKFAHTADLNILSHDHSQTKQTYVDTFQEAGVFLFFHKDGKVALLI